MIGVNCGHTIEGAGSGAVGILKESVHTRLVGNRLMEKLSGIGVKTVNCTVDRAASQEAYLERAVQTANQHAVDLFISIHFNASRGHNARGAEVYTYGGKKLPEALSVCSHLERLGFINRGIRDGSGLYVIRRTKARAMLVEVCFCDNREDVAVYERAGAENAVADAIFNALCETVPAAGTNTSQKEEFIHFVGEIARRDWDSRKIILPSVVIAQAIKESAWGTSELARNANALFGVKRNGWNGAIYIKDADEERTDGSHYTVSQTQWRAYGSWEESILDHNTYIAERSTDGGKTLRYAPVISCPDYALTAKLLQECGYATAHDYAESLVHGYIEKYSLMRFDSRTFDA